MISRHGCLRQHGLDSPLGTIRARELHKVLSALPASSERATRLALREPEPILFRTEDGRTPLPSDPPPHPPSI